MVVHACGLRTWGVEVGGRIRNSKSSVAAATMAFGSVEAAWGHVVQRHNTHTQRHTEQHVHTHAHVHTRTYTHTDSKYTFLLIPECLLHAAPDFHLRDYRAFWRSKAVFFRATRKQSRGVLHCSPRVTPVDWLSEHHSRNSYTQRLGSRSWPDSSAVSILHKITVILCFMLL